MRAIRVLEYGGQLVFNDVPTPTITRDEILVKIKSTGVNHLDLVKASGTARQLLPIDLPWIPGHEFSGLVEQVGSDVAAYAPGDAVFAANGTGGGYAEYLAVKPALVAKKPTNLSFEEAASVPVGAQTAWQGIFTHAHLEKGERILILGGAGAVGGYAVQLASHIGATVIATASGDDEAYVKSIGAKQFIDYRKGQLDKELHEKVDVVFDLVGGDTQQRSYLVLKEGGRLVSAVQPVSNEEAAKHRVSAEMMRLAPAAEVLGIIARLLEERTIWPDVATVYALQDATQAWKDIAEKLPRVHGTSPSGPGAARQNSHGKIVLRVAWTSSTSNTSLAITRRDSEMTYDNEAIVRNAYHTAEGNVLDIPGWIGSFTEDGVFNNVTGEESYRGEHLKDVVITFGKMFPDVHRELYRINVLGDVVAIELAIQGTFRGPMETPAGVLQPTGAKVNIPCADFFYMRNGKIERFDCYPALNIMLMQMGVPPDFASAVRRSTRG